MGVIEGPEAVAALAQLPRIVPARLSSLRAGATPTTSTDRPCPLKAAQRSAARGPPRARAWRKLGLTGRIDIVRFTLENGLLRGSEEE